MDRAGDPRALDWLAAGAAASFCVDVDGSLRCRVCGFSELPERAVADVVQGGPAVPEPEAAVLAVHCAGCGERGVALLATGPTATPGHRALLRCLDAAAPSSAASPR